MNRAGRNLKIGADTMPLALINPNALSLNKATPRVTKKKKFKSPRRSISPNIIIRENELGALDNFIKTSHRGMTS